MADMAVEIERPEDVTPAAIVTTTHTHNPSSNSGNRKVPDRICLKRSRVLHRPKEMLLLTHTLPGAATKIIWRCGMLLQPSSNKQRAKVSSRDRLELPRQQRDVSTVTLMRLKSSQRLMHACMTDALRFPLCYGLILITLLDCFRLL
jgi:hypothetical protein